MMYLGNKRQLYHPCIENSASSMFLVRIVHEPDVCSAGSSITACLLSNNMQMLSCIAQRSAMTRSQNGITWVWIKPGRLWCGLTSGRLCLIVPKARDTIKLSFIQILHGTISGNCSSNPINSSFDTNDAFALCHFLQIFTEAPSKWLYHRVV